VRLTLARLSIDLSPLIGIYRPWVLRVYCRSRLTHRAVNRAEVTAAAAIGYTYPTKFPHTHSMGITVDWFSMRFGPRPARYSPRSCISLILDDYIDAAVKSIEREAPWIRVSRLIMILANRHNLFDSSIDFYVIADGRTGQL